MNVDIVHVTFLGLLDRSTTFDTVDHDILIRKLQSLLGLRVGQLFSGLILPEKSLAALSYNNYIHTRMQTVFNIILGIVPIRGYM